MIAGLMRLEPVPLISLLSRGLNDIDRLVPSFLMNSTLTILLPQLKMKLLIALIFSLDSFDKRVMILWLWVCDVEIEAHEIIVINL